MKLISAEQILYKKFTTEIEGYKVESVNSFLDELYQQTSFYEEQNELLKKENESLKENLDKLENQVKHYQDILKESENKVKILEREKYSNIDFVKSASIIVDLNKKMDAILSKVAELEKKAK